MAVALLGSPSSNTPGVGNFDAGAPYSTFTYAVSAGSNRLLVLFLCTGDNQLISASTVTYGGQAGTQILGYLKTDANFCLVQAYYWLEAGIAAAASTTFSITAWSTADIISSLIVGAAAFSGVHQTVPFGTVAVATGISTAPSTGSITVGTDELAIGSVATDDDNTFTEGNTSLFKIEGLGSDFGGSAQSRTTTGAITWTTDNVAWAAAGIAIKPVAGAVVVALEWKQPTSQPTSHFTPTITSFLRGMPNPVPYLTTTPTAVTGVLDWIAPSVDIVWT